MSAPGILLGARSAFATACALLTCLLSGCVTPPADPASRPAPDPGQATPSAVEALEARHYEQARTYARERNWADALVQWELLALLKPDSTEYRNALAETRARIRETADTHARAAEQARRQGNLDQATVLYLRALNVDRENAAAAQALRDIDAERTRRAYLNRPPR
jgi:tetratricopeptide (TPR) repeat protein